MKLKHQHAVISFCPNLTDPNAESIPIAVMLVGEMGDVRLAGLATHLPSSLLKSLDPISREILTRTPMLLRQHVNDAVAELEDGDAPLDKLLRNLHHALRNSLHVSEIRGVREAELPEANDSASVVYPAIVQTLVSVATDELATPSSRNPMLGVARRNDRKPEVNVWPVEH